MKFKLSENTNLKESSLSRLNSYLDEYDVAFITAYKKGPLDPNFPGGPQWTRKMNQDNNHDLKLRLEARGYEMFRVHGSYYNHERNDIDKEISYVVINKNNKNFEDFKNDIIELGRRYKQESVMIFERGDPVGNFYYMSGKVETAGGKHFGTDSLYKSIVDGRPFVVEELEYCQRGIKTQTMYDKYRK